METIGFGGGCHWCTEAVFQSLKGIASVSQGFISSDPPDNSFSEAVLVKFDPESVTLSDLVKAHLLTHASTSNHSMRAKYRSAVYATGQKQSQAAAQILQDLEMETGAKFVTRVLALTEFRPSPDQFRNYYAQDPGRPFCQTYIDPKLAKLRRDLPTLMKTSETA